MNRIAPEVYTIERRLALLVRLKEYFQAGYRDPGLLYLGGRYAVSLGMAEEACQWLEPLAGIFMADGKATPGYFPVALLYLYILPQGEKRETVKQHLRNLSSNNPERMRLLEEVLFTSELYFPEKPITLDMLRSHPSLYEMSRDIIKKFHIESQNSEVRLTEILITIRYKKPVQNVQRLSKAATHAFYNNNSAEARLALENILLIDGDQPNVLRNLITLTGGQRDIEAYERYWKRYVRVLLWRIMRGDGSASAWYDLVLFYKKTAAVMERECDTSQNDVIKVLPRPGFLSRWLESMAGLVWLECAAQPWRSRQTGIDIAEMKKGQLGNLSLMEYWFQVFYPDFYSFLEIPGNTQGPISLMGLETNFNLSFDPKFKLLTRFLQWYKFHFAFTDETNIYHQEALIALRGFVKRLPLKRYIKDLAEKFGNEFKNMTISEVINEALNLLLNIEIKKKVQELVTKGNLDGARKVIRELPDEAEELKENLLNQIDELEVQCKHQQNIINNAIAKIKKHLENKRFKEARRVIEELPAEAIELKQNLSGQLDEIEKWNRGY